MAIQTQLRRGTTSQHGSFTGAVGEVTVDTDKDTLKVHDGSTAGGHEITQNAATQTLTNKTLTSPDINTPDIDGGSIDGVTMATSDITVGSGKTLNVSAGTLTLADDQISGDKINGGSISSTFVGNLTGDVTGNVSGTAATVTGAAQSAITSVGNLTSLNIVGTTTSDFFVVQTNEDGTGSAPDVTLYRNSASPADNDYLGKVEFRGRNDNSQDVAYAQVISMITDASDGTEDGRMYLQSKVAGADKNHLMLDAAGVTVDGALLPNGDNNKALGSDAARWGSLTCGGTVSFGWGSAAAPGLSINSDTDNGFFRGGANILAASTAGTERLRITAAGDVGVGTTAPSAFGGTTMQVHNASTYSALLVSSNDHVLQMLASDTHGAQSIGTRSNHDLNLTANDSVKVTVKTDGKVGIGTTAPVSPLTSEGDISIASTVDSDNGDLGEINFWNRTNAGSGSGTSFVNDVASIKCEMVGSGNNSGGDLHFYTKADGGSKTEALTITGAGDVAGTDFVMQFPPSTPPSGTQTVYQNGSITSTDASMHNTPVPVAMKVKKMYAYVNGALSSGSAVITLRKNATDQSGTISVGTGTSAFNSSPDITYAAGDRIGIKIALSGTSAAWYHVTLLAERLE